MNEKGFAYLTLLFLIVVMGITLAMTGDVWTTVKKRELEEELLFRGMEIKRGIERFLNEQKRLPMTLDELVKYPTLPQKRYLRKIYADPMTGKQDWDFIKEGKSIAGVKSKSKEEPFKKANFPEELKSFERKSEYSEWEFRYSPVEEQGKKAKKSG